MLLDVGREWTWGAELYQGTDELFVFFLQCKIEKMLAKLCFDRPAFNKIYLLTAETSVKSARFRSDPNFFCALYCCSTNATH